MFQKATLVGSCPILRNLFFNFHNFTNTFSTRFHIRLLSGYTYSTGTKVMEFRSFVTKKNYTNVMGTNTQFYVIQQTFN